MPTVPNVVGSDRALIQVMSSATVVGGSAGLPMIHNGEAASSEIGWRSRKMS